MITQLLSHDLAYALAWTLVHSLWQIALVAAVLSIVLRLTKKKSPQARYLISFASLGVIVLMSLVTFAIYYGESPSNTQALIAGFSRELVQESQLSINSIFQFIDGYLFVIVNTWLLGTILFILKLVGGYAFIKRLTKAAVIENDGLNKKLGKLRTKFKIHRAVKLKQSDRISTPMVVGFIKPIILFPVGLVNQLSGDEVAAILAHELAHIKRHDFVFNLIQSLAEAIFYYHLGIWYISSAISKERENCCDDMAIAYTGNKVSYAKTLIRLQELRLQTLEPALAMAGKTGNFAHRIRRILDVPIQRKQVKEKLIAALLICFTMMGFAKESTSEQYMDAEDMDVYIIDDCPQNIDDIKYYVDTIPERNNFHVKRSSKDKNLELKMEDGEITQLIIDGETIPESDYDEMEDIIVEMIPDGKRDIITVFPDCGENFGNIYYLNKEKQIVNLDSILDNVSERMNAFEDYELDKFEFHSDKFDKIFIDSLRLEIGGIDWDRIIGEERLMVDSIFDLLPHRFPTWKDTIRSFTYIQPGALKQSTIADAPLLKLQQLKNEPPKWITCDKITKSLEVITPNCKDLPFKLENFNNQTRWVTASNSVSDLISNELKEDRLIDEVELSKIELSGKKLKINGEKQPTNIWKKYKLIYEETTGIQLTKNSMIEIEIDPALSKSYRAFPSSD